MTPSHLTFHHLGLAARRPDEAQHFMGRLGYQLGNPVFDALQNVHLQLGLH
jgi:catechol 2,3-dioxygenase-like lactoylglutathione lyase family enzyme